MPVYKSSDQLYAVLKSLFQLIGQADPSASDSIISTKLIIHMRFSDPAAELSINARSNPVTFHYGSASLRPDIDIQMQADAFHKILLAELSLRKALGSGQMKVKGPIYKSFALADIFHRGQAVYVEILKDQGIKG